MAIKIKQNQNGIIDQENESEDSDLEREVNSQPAGKEESKGDMNFSVANGRSSSNNNKLIESHSTKSQQKVQYSQTVTSDLFKPQKKLKISEKKLFIKQIVLNSSINTSFNPSRVQSIAQADINFEIIVEGE